MVVDLPLVVAGRLVVVEVDGTGTAAAAAAAAAVVVVVEGAVEVVATRSQEGHMVSVVAGSCM